MTKFVHYRNLCGIKDTVMNLKEAKPISPEPQAEISRFCEEIEKLEKGSRDPDDFKRFRLENGVYGIRGTTDEHMIRVKVPFGRLNADQLEGLAGIAERFTPLKVGHVTTRQAVQFHHVKRRDVPEVLKLVNQVGLTTREACGNTVRNVSCCHYSGISPDELFDVTPYAKILVPHFLRNKLNQNLPRKFKIAFEGCLNKDHARVGIHDLGFVAATREASGKVEKGFKVYVGGGLGTIPFPAQLLEEFLPVSEYLAATEAVLRIFDRYGERKDRNRARIKFLVDKWGIEEFKKVYLEEKKIAILTSPGIGNQWDFELTEEEAPQQLQNIPADTPSLPPAEYDRWLKTSVFLQKQKGFYAVNVRCPLGDISVPQMRDVAKISRTFCAGSMRTTISQNIILHWVPEKSLKALYQELRKAGLALSDAEYITDITRCPGADTCQIAITHSRGLAAEMAGIFNDGYATDPAFKNLTIKISGCTNSCGQHHIADIGFHGASKVVNGHAVPHYQLLLGGYTQTGEAVFGKRIIQIPARRVPEAVKKILDLYKSERTPNETFRSWSERSAEYLKKTLAPYAEIPPYEKDPQMYQDLGDKGDFELKMGKGECAA